MLSPRSFSVARKVEARWTDIGDLRSRISIWLCSLPKLPPVEWDPWSNPATMDEYAPYIFEVAPGLFPGKMLLVSHSTRQIK